ncbi:hypothetical protein T08_14776 [Trichinella sp. T8]|nr:hypothetical protein T08_14776 [Trichinella sp. T8]
MSPGKMLTRPEGDLLSPLGGSSTIRAYAPGSGVLKGLRSLKESSGRTLPKQGAVWRLYLNIKCAFIERRQK